MWNCPIYGSQINPRAKLYKRYTPKETAQLNGKDIQYEGNRFATYHSLAWVEVSEKELKKEQLIDGGVVKTGEMTIKLHGRYEPEEGNPDEPEANDLLNINGKWWMIKDIVKRRRIKSLINFATVFLTLVKINRDQIIGE